MHEASANAEFQGRIRPYWVYYTQLYLALQEVIFVTRTRDHEVTRQQLYCCTKLLSNMVSTKFHLDFLSQVCEISFPYSYRVQSIHMLNT